MIKTNVFPDMLEAQCYSFCWFLSYGLNEKLSSFSKKYFYTHSLTYTILGNEYTLKLPKYTDSDKYTIERLDFYNIIEIKVPIELELKAKSRSYIKLEKLIINVPMMTTYATFLVNSLERVIVSQISRSPGIIFNRKDNMRNSKVFTFDFYHLKNLYFFSREKKHIIESQNILNAIQKKILNVNKIKQKVYSAVIIPEFGSWNLLKINSKTKASKFGKYSKNNLILDIILESKGYPKISLFNLLRKGGLTDYEIYNNLIYADWFYLNKPKYEETIGNGLKVFDPSHIFLGLTGRLKINNLLDLPINEKITSVTYNDFFAIIDKFIEFILKEDYVQDFDHLKNKRVKLPGRILQDVVHEGFCHLIKGLSKRNIKDNVWRINLNHHIITQTIGLFFNSNPLSQFLDQTNPLSLLTHTRRLSYYGSGGLKKGAVSFNIRDIHPSQYGRICTVETAEGSNVGVVNSLTVYAKINKLGLLETPFWRVINGKVIKNANPIYLTADIEDSYKIATADNLINDKNYLINKLITVRYKQRFISVLPAEVEFLSISTVQTVSIGASLVPFFEHNDANRVLMGSSMQRQSIPLLYSQKPIVGTGLETKVVDNSGMILKSQTFGTVDFVSSDKIIISESKDCSFIYNLEKHAFSNQKTYINQTPIVWKGEKVKPGQSLTNGPSILDGELSLGRNLLVAYMPWHGYNFEDAILINERLIYDNVFTSIHVERYKIETNSGKKKKEHITRNIPRINSSLIKNLDKDGLVKPGTFVKSGDILVGKIIIAPKKEEKFASRLIRAIFKDKSPYTIDKSLKLPNGKYGRVAHVATTTNSKKGVINSASVWVAQIRKIQVGDKLAGRHGNKGVISKILARQDMPFLPDGTPIDILLNPLGVPSRMNVGQLYECLLGLAGINLNKRFKVLPFDEKYGSETSRILINRKLRQASIKQNKSWLFNPYMPGKMILVDGQTGIEFENPITVGNAYLLKLIHMVEDKMHSRYIGPYSVLTQQPLKGKALKGGQRFGEMEVWALEGFGAVHSLREILTIKSDDLSKRETSVGNISRGKLITKFGVPESFKVFLQELRAVGLDIKAYRLNEFNSVKNYENEIQIIQTID
uniref:DNA-directed RNA polymerase subunit beta n=1 Tax=Nitzschia sp. PL3-2 TaxID=2083271 RepID=A0A2Z5ZAR3_9STRA|nr:RNA polymerase beta subunit [Nitzschia sp. PL3-2]